MDQTNRHFELRFTNDNITHPDGPNSPYTAFRSDDMIGNGGRVFVSNWSSSAKTATTEVPYSHISHLWQRDVYVEGILVVRLRRTFNGNIVGEWVSPAADRAAVSPPGTASSPNSEGATGAPQTEYGNALASAERALHFVGDNVGHLAPYAAPALKFAGDLLSKSSGKPWQVLGSLMSGVSREISQSSGPEKLAGEVGPKELPAYEPGLSERGAHSTSQGNYVLGHDVTPEAATGVERAFASPAEASEIPKERSCDRCTHFRPYVRISERLTEELEESLSEETVARALNELVSHEEKGKGEEARRLADLYRRGKDRWGNRPPSFFSYCAARERDQREPTIFIAQIRNPDLRCRPVKRADGQRWDDAPTDFTPNGPTAHSCSSCAYRIRATGPAEDAREIREIVSQAIQAAGLSAAVGSKGGEASSLLSSFPETKRKNAATARAREIAEVFARRGSDSHASIEPRYLDRCGLKSDSRINKYRVCAVENPHQRCPDWTSI